MIAKISKIYLILCSYVPMSLLFYIFLHFYISVMVKENKPNSDKNLKQMKRKANFGADFFLPPLVFDL